MQWVGVITFITVAFTVISIVWWPGWLVFAAGNIALAALAFWFMHDDPRIHEAE
jgi:hypothetical protein